MNVMPLARRPLGCLKTSLRRARQQKTILVRSMATETASPDSPAATASAPEHGFFRLTDRKTKSIRSAFAVYPSTASTPGSTPSTLLPPPKKPLDALHEAQIKKMDPTGARTALFSKSNRDAVKVGDILMVTHRRGGEPFAGVCLSIRRRGIDSAILLRNHLSKVGVEMWYKIYNKNVAGIEIVKRRPKRARRARLTYMRKPKHDMGSVEEMVYAWKKSRRVFTTAKSKKELAAEARAAAKGAKGAKGKK
ncbi:hypothetical protein MFIFM68171_10898 [Madurella fahalii]|uniref:Ribosomal protein L19 n=1 Tax=Madurella fahalii TaxID=1157608 RepID=A0ABQ0GSH2_9PEZI